MTHEAKKRDPVKHVIPRLSMNEVRVFTEQLPSPISVWRMKDILFRVYRTKSLLNPQWAHNALHHLLVHARGSYYVYGGRPPLDEYDAKAVPYLVRVTYPIFSNGKKYIIEEWLSDRLVTGIGEPLGGGELNLFLYRGKKVEYWMQKKFFRPHENYLEHTVTSNRMCTINPYFANHEDEQLGIELPPRQRYTAICYALMVFHFWKDYLQNSPYRYTTSILQTRVIEKAMTVEVSGKRFQNVFMPAHQFFGFSNPDCIQLNRDAHEGIVYKFPLYFLNAQKLAALLQRLITCKMLSTETIKYYLGETSLVKEAEGGITSNLFKKLRNSGRLLSEEDKIVGSKMTGESLRRLVDREVPDGPELKITEVEKTFKSARDILTAAQAVRC